MGISLEEVLVFSVFALYFQSVIAVKATTRTPLDLKYQTIIEQGLTGIFWEEDNFQHDLDECHKIKLISSSCHHDLNFVFEGFSKLHPTSYQLLDASSKATAGILQGNVLALGDYDACMYIKADVGSKRSFQGMHCSIEVELDDATNKSSYGKIYTDHLPALGAFHPKYSMCLPSSCTTQEIEYMVKTRISRYPMKLSTPKPYPLEFDTKITCDTKETNSFLYRLSNMTSGQIFALLVIICIVSVINVSTVISLISPDNFLADLSVVNSVKRLFEPKIHDMEVLAIEIMKAWLIFSGFVGHSVVFVEKVIATNMMQSPHFHARSFLSHWLFQPCNDGLMFAFAVFGGYAMYKGVFNKITAGVFSPIKALVSRYMKYILLTSGVILLEYVYPLLGDGPVWSYVSGRIFEDCQNNWWRHYVMAGHTNAIRGCSIHLFMASVDFRLFVYGLILLYVMNKSRKIGIALCVATILVCNVIVHESTKHLALPVMFGNPIDIKLASDFFYTVHFLISYYLPAYCVGILTAVWMESGYELYTPSLLKSYLHYNAINVYALLVLFAPGLHNVLGIIPQSWNGVFIVLHRNAYSLFVLWLFSLVSHFPFERFDHLLQHFLKKKSRDVNYNGTVSDHEADPVTKRKLDMVSIIPLPIQMVTNAFLRLIVSLHAVNMLCIRFHFTTSRSVHSLLPYDIIMRWSSFTLMVLLVPLLFHLYFTAPLEVVYSKMFPRQDNRKKKVQ